MIVNFESKSYTFQPWRPEMGRVFSSVFSFDIETTLIDDARHWVPPAYVIGAAFDGTKGYFVTRDHCPAFFEVHRDLQTVFHNANFDLAVVDVLAPELDIYEAVDRNLVWDTLILHRLYRLGTTGDAASGKGQATLEHCAKVYLGTGLPKDVLDQSGDQVRVSYGKWLNKAPSEIDLVYLDYLAKDVVATLSIYQELRHRLSVLLLQSRDVWGYAGEDWIADQLSCFGPQTHHIQLRGSIVLRSITAAGLRLDVEQREDLVATLREQRDALKTQLRGYGYLPGEAGNDKALQAIFQRLDRDNPHLRLPRTESGEKFSTRFEVLQELASTVPFAQLLVDYRAVDKLLNTFLKRMDRRVLHPSFNILARSGRTSSFGEINAQNLPRDDRVRTCFVPSPGHVFINADYSTVEMATLAQVCIRQLGLKSEMAEAINEGKDLHRLVASRVLHKEESEVTSEERQQAKAINFGKPGGMSDASLRQYAKASYGVDLSEEEVAVLSNAWFDRFPEMRAFLGEENNLAADVAALCGLTHESHYGHTGDGRFLNHPANHGMGDRPCPILGGMFLKTMKEPDPETRAGRVYQESDVDYFWARAESLLKDLPKKYHAAISGRRPSKKLMGAILSLVGRAGVFTFTGRLRANATYCARHNTTFQGLAADGAKLALWRLWRAGYRIVNFIHDEVLIEVPEDENLGEHAETIRHHMIAGMKQVLPDLRVEVEYAATDRWYKGAKPSFNDHGDLCLWQPEQITEQLCNVAK